VALHCLPGNTEWKSVAARVDLDEVGKILVVQCVQLCGQLHKTPRGLDHTYGPGNDGLGSLNDRVVQTLPIVRLGWFVSTSLVFPSGELPFYHSGSPQELIHHKVDDSSGGGGADRNPGGSRHACWTHRDTSLLLF